MSKIINLWEISHEDQDKLWIEDICPKCGSKILDTERNIDFARWLCSRCDVMFLVE